MNALDLLAQFLVIVVTTFSVLFVGFVVKRAGGKARYLAGFRNWSQFFAVMIDVSAFFCR